MAYGKFRNGPTSLGRQAANWVQDGLPTFSTRRRGDVVVRKSGDFTNIFQDQKLDGYYSLGRVAAGGTRIRGSSDARTFSDRGPAPEAGGFVTSQLAYYGKGQGGVISNNDVGNFLDFDGRPCRVFTTNLQLTRTGKQLKDHYAVDSFVPYLGGYALVTYTRGGYWQDGAAHKFYAGVAVPILLEDGQHVQAYVTDDGANQAFGDVLYVANQLGWFPDILHLAPGVLLKMDRYLRPVYSPTAVNAAACPVLTFTYSMDAGRTWSPCSSTNMFDAEIASMRGIPLNETGAQRFNQGISDAEITSAPLSRRYSVVVARVPYVDGSNAVRVKVKLGLVDVAAGCSLMETQVLYEGTGEDAGIYAGRAPLAVPGGVLIFTRNIPAPLEGRKAWMYPARVRFTPNGTDLVDRAAMPFKENYTGIVSGLSTKLMVCPMWDGKHSLYQSADYGQTWSRRGTIARDGLPPNDAPAPGQEQLSLADFTVVTFLRDNDLPVSAFPLTPWLTDSRRPNPPPI
ncbi:hypothetical protein APR50_23125 [Variovorax paradoxus]|jgi:hypothetical protein|uniref:hypothetical protein n=1 Tax=Variovorax paradoxus TaxID=34073 RepID=UPI0006E64C5E|nr:hypothetical protein APR52_14185 [Variovorax paradoxus]KPV04052.1 hypothetical protein APR50_23125 [Variovorax paradoxus]KPV08111.1 hypothetical protein APR49_16255 [Variovorax paradoxus]KPV22575.1 hypothetical protein APR51_10250 [Variovorax paradoxus]KPV35355.1 hypothetical protein APR48_04200 [Variovorax paradoxus]